MGVQHRNIHSKKKKIWCHNIYIYSMVLFRVKMEIGCEDWLICDGLKRVQGMGGAVWGKMRGCTFDFPANRETWRTVERERGWGVKSENLPKQRLPEVRVHFSTQFHIQGPRSSAKAWMLMQSCSGPSAPRCFMKGNEYSAVKKFSPPYRLFLPFSFFVLFCFFNYVCQRTKEKQSHSYAWVWTELQSRFQGFLATNL